MKMSSEIPFSLQNTAGIVFEKKTQKHRNVVSFTDTFITKIELNLDLLRLEISLVSTIWKTLCFFFDP